MDNLGPLLAYGACNMNKVFEVKFGSHLYGTDTSESDLDLKGIFLPTARQIVLGNYTKTVNISRPKKECERNTKDDVDIEMFSLDRYLELLTDGQTVALDLLFAPKSMYTFAGPSIDLMRHIFDNRDKLLTKNVNAFVGYARQQAAKYGIKGSRMDSLKRVMALLGTLPVHDKLSLHESKIYGLIDECKELISLEKSALVEVAMIPGPNRVDLMPHLSVCNRKVPFQATVKFAKEVYGRILDGYGQRAHKAHLAGGVDWKAISHAVRVNGEALELLRTGFITFPRPERALLLDIKLGKMPYEAVAEKIERGLADLYEAKEKSPLREEHDQEWVEDFICAAYTDIVCS